MVFAGKVRFQLPEATFKMTTPAVAEVVLEFDSRLTSKSDIDKIKDSPIVMFKQAVNEALPNPNAAITLYGYRTSHHPGATKQECQLQCVLKAPSVSRKSLLEVSGLSMRTYRAAGVHTWVVTAQELPKASRFTLEINRELVEILVQEVVPSQPARPSAKGKSKGKSKGNDVPAEPIAPWPLKMPAQSQARPDDLRIDRLEERFEKLESRQAQFEGRVDSKFDTIQDSLRQLLANTNPRARDASGETAPGKHQKNISQGTPAFLGSAVSWLCLCGFCGFSFVLLVDFGLSLSMKSCGALGLAFVISPFSFGIIGAALSHWLVLPSSARPCLSFAILAASWISLASAASVSLIRHCDISCVNAGHPGHLLDAMGFMWITPSLC